MSDNANGECVATGGTPIKSDLPHDNDITSEKIVGIYGLRCRTTNKWYIGQSIDVYSRWDDYLKLRCKNQRKLYHALKKYGYDGFEKMVIEECDNVDWILDYREMYWIKQFNAFIDGYNLTEGGHIGLTFKGLKHTSETKAKMSASGKGRKLSSNSIEKMRKSLRGRKWTDAQRKSILTAKRNMSSERIEKWKKKLSIAGLGRVGHIPTPEQRRRMSESHLGKNSGNQNPAFGKRWITNGTENKLIDVSIGILDGWKLGKIGTPVSDESRAKISNANTGKTRTKEVRRKMSESRVGKKRGSYNIKVSQIGWKRSDECREKMREAWKRRKEHQLIMSAA